MMYPPAVINKILSERIIKSIEVKDGLLIKEFIRAYLVKIMVSKTINRFL
jgi:hypothetical protein